MSISSTMTRSMASPERKRCSNMALVLMLRSLAWMKARRLPGVRCSTWKTRCSWSLCLMIMPGRICVAEIAIERKLLAVLSGLLELVGPYRKDGPTVIVAQRAVAGPEIAHEDRRPRYTRRQYGFCSRQLRFVYLQPGAVFGRAGGGYSCAPQ